MDLLMVTRSFERRFQAMPLEVLSRMVQRRLVTPTLTTCTLMESINNRNF